MTQSWVAGDLTCGPGVASAVADGDRVARLIDQFFAVNEEVA